MEKDYPVQIMLKNLWNPTIRNIDTKHSFISFTSGVWGEAPTAKIFASYTTKS